MQKIVCPMCQDDDQIQKVSAVVKGGTTSLKSGGPSHGFVIVDGKLRPVVGGAQQYGRSTTDLAQLLAEPARPKGPHWFYYGCAGYLLFVGICALCNGLYEPGNAVLGLIFVAIGAYPVHLIRRKLKERDTILPSWELARDRWDRFYYCYRDDIVFDPENGQCWPSDEIRRACYEAPQPQSSADAHQVTVISG